ncbi:hypothetical protein PC116_g29845, partial [Phytophthora cactorum]
KKAPAKVVEKEVEEIAEELESDELAGGFIRDEEKGTTDDDKVQESEAARPLPPWMMQDESDIRESLKAQQASEREINEQDRLAALEEERQRRKDAVIEIDSSDDDSDVQIVEAPPSAPQKGPTPVVEDRSAPRLSPATLTRVNPPVADDEDQMEDTRRADIVQEQTASQVEAINNAVPSPESASKSASPEPDFEEVEILQPPEEPVSNDVAPQPASPEPTFEDVDVPAPEAFDSPIRSNPVADANNDEIFGDAEFDDNEFSDPEEEELLAQMAEEAEEHARFASQLNHKSEKENQEAYERELKALRTQQKKDRRDADEVTQVMITECQALLRYFGITLN